MAEPRGTVVGKLIYLITGDETALKTDLDKAKANIKKFGQEMDRLGSRLTTTLTLPIAAAGIAALKFATELEESQETTQAFQQTLTDLKEASASLVESFLPAIRGMLEWISGAAKSIAAMDEGTKRLILTIAALAAAVGPVMKAFGTLSMVLAVNPYIAAAAAIAALVVGIGIWIKETDRARRASSDLANQLKNTTAALTEQQIAILSEQKAAAIMRAQVLEPELALRKEQLAAVRAQLAAERERSGVVRNLDTAVGQSASTQRKLTLEEAKLSSTVLTLNAELENQTTIYTEAHRLIVEALQGRAALSAAIVTTTTAVKEETAAIYDEAAALAADGAQWEAFTALVISRVRDAAEAQRAAAEEAEKLKQKYEQIGAMIYSTLAPAFQAMGQAIVDSSSGWEAFKDAAKNAIASVLDMLARLWVTQASAHLVPSPLTFNPAAAAGLFAKAIAATVAAGFVRALASGGDFVTNGPQLIAVGDNPGGRERVTVTPESSPNIAGGADLPLHIVVNLDGRPIADFVTRATRRRQILVDAGSVI